MSCKHSEVYETPRMNREAAACEQCIYPLRPRPIAWSPKVRPHYDLGVLAILLNKDGSALTKPMPKMRIRSVVVSKTTSDRIEVSDREWLVQL